MKKTIAFLLVLTMAMTMFGCAKKISPTTPEAPTTDSKAASAQKTEATAEKIKIGLSLPSLISQYFEGVQKAAEEISATENVELVVVNANGDASEQKSQIQSLISGGCQAVITLSQDSDAIVSSAADCKAAGIPFIALDRQPSDLKDVDLFLGFSNEQAAGLCAQAMADAAKEMGYEKVQVIEMVGDLNDTNAVERKNFFEAKAKELGFEIVAEVPTEWNVDTAFNRLTDTVQNTASFNAIYSPSDILIPAIMSVLTTRGEWVEFGAENHKIITCIDGSPSGVAAVKSGFVYATSNNDAFVIGKQGILSALDMIRNGAPEEKIQALESAIVTKEVAEQAGDTIWGNAFAE
ncbi:MAG: sugar ABC transporter substrate-binding protein [Ruthenibacterium sp.]